MELSPKQLVRRPKFIAGPSGKYRFVWEEALGLPWPSNRSWPVVTISAPVRSATFNMVSSCPGFGISSSSMNRTYFPLACFAPVFLAAPKYLLGSLKTFQPRSCHHFQASSWRNAMASGSVLPSSTRTTSKSWKVCFSMASMVCWRSL